MKKIFNLMLLCIMAIGFASCERDDAFYSKEQIIGTWVTTQGFIGGAWVDIPSDSDMYATMSFYENGNYYGNSDLFGSGWGTYTLKGKRIKTYIGGDLFYTYTIRSLTDTSAEVTMAYHSSNLRYRLKKMEE